MPIKEKINHISRRKFLYAAGGGAAALVAAPVAVHVGKRSHEISLEERIEKYLNDQLNDSATFAWPDSEHRPTAGRFLLKQANNTLLYSPINDKHEFDQYRLFDAPVVAFASASDPLFDDLKKSDVVGAEHKSPTEWLPGARSVISFYHPFSEQVRVTNHPEGLPSKAWLAAKASAEYYLAVVSHSLVQFLTGLGARAVSPSNDSRFQIARTNGKIVPNWSERHVGYVAGLGTFGLHRSLITRKGSVGRLSSVITDLELVPTHRSYTNKNAYCLYYVNGSCDVCVNRCPGHAVSKTGDGQAAACSKYCQSFVVPSIAPLPYKGGCGKCLNAVPCEIGIPEGIKV